MDIGALSQLGFTDSGRRHTSPPGYLSGARYAISAEDAKANNKNKNNKAKEDNNIKNNAKQYNRDNPKQRRVECIACASKCGSKEGGHCISMRNVQHGNEWSSVWWASPEGECVIGILGNRSLALVIAFSSCALIA